MFDQPPEGFDATTAIEQFRTAERTALRAHNQQFVLAAFWPDLHATDGLPLAGSVDATLTGERAIRIGGPGTPPVAEFVAASLAVETGWSVHKMRYFLADAVDVRYRYPRIFDRIREGRLPRWTAQRISRATRDITLEQAEQVEDILLPKIAGVTGQRLDNLITAALITVDAERYERLAEKARRARYFRISQGNDHGLTDFYGRMETADAIRLKAMVERIVTILRQHPDDPPPASRTATPPPPTNGQPSPLAPWPTRSAPHNSCSSTNNPTCSTRPSPHSTPSSLAAGHTRRRSTTPPTIRQPPSTTRPNRRPTNPKHRPIRQPTDSRHRATLLIMTNRSRSLSMSKGSPIARLRSGAIITPTTATSPSARSSAPSRRRSCWHRSPSTCTAPPKTSPPTPTASSGSKNSAPPPSP